VCESAQHAAGILAHWNQASRARLCPNARAEADLFARFDLKLAIARSR
jgi:hypothetical protein